MNYFHLFGLTANFTIDIGRLSELYQALQKTVHPDRFAHASSQDQMIAVQKSAMINDAYQTLKKPLKRAEYLLKLRGSQMLSEQASFSDNQFLMRQMELREMLTEVKFSDDANSEIDKINQTLDEEFLILFNSMQSKLDQDTNKANELAYEELRKLKFYQKLHIELERLEEQLFAD